MIGLWWFACGANDLAWVPLERGQLELASVFDPTAGPLDVPDGAASVVVRDASGAIVRVLGTSNWDGLDDAGEPAPVGTYTVEGLTSDGVVPLPVAAEVHLVRVGITSVYAEGDGDTAIRVPLYWHGDEVLTDDTAPIATTALDGAGFPAVWSSLTRAPTDDATQPVAWTATSRPILTFVPGESARWGGSGVDGLDVQLEVDGWTVLSGLPLTAGTPIVLQKDTALSETLGVIEDTLQLRFTVDDDGAPLTIATQALPYRFYATFGDETFTEEDVRYHAWVAAIDPALRGIAGTVPEHDAVVDALVAWIYLDAGLRYDTRWGASVYVEYRDDRWNQAHFLFSDFLERRMGTIVNCTDCAAILGAYANMLGAELNYTIILQNFPLNQIKAIGVDAFTACPFGPSYCGFSYHAVTTDDAGGTIWDATLALDGDDAPNAAPSTELLVQTIDGVEYLDRLTDGAAYYRYESQGTLQ